MGNGATKAGIHVIEVDYFNKTYAKYIAICSNVYEWNMAGSDLILSSQST